MTSQVHLPPWAGLDEVFFQYLLYRGRALPPRLRFAAFRGLPSHTEKSYGFHALYPLPLLAECMLRTISVSCLIDRVTGRPYSEGPRGRQPALCGDMFDFHPGALGSTCTPRSLSSAASRCTPPKCLRFGPVLASSELWITRAHLRWHGHGFTWFPRLEGVPFSTSSGKRWRAPLANHDRRSFAISPLRFPLREAWRYRAGLAGSRYWTST